MTEAPGSNAVSGRVSAIEYQGTWLKITIEDACREEFVANVPDHVFFADPLKVGDAVIAQLVVRSMRSRQPGPLRLPIH